MKHDKPSHYEGNFRPGMGYVVWKMAGFPPGGLSMGEQSSVGTISKCQVDGKPFFQKGKEKVCYRHLNGTKN